jgi:hypothetical protein
MDSNYKENRLKIDGYFTELKNKIDLLVEIYTNDNQHEPVRIDETNRARGEWIKEIDECEAHDLADLEKNDNKHIILEVKELFKRFCFIIRIHGDVFTTGRFIWRFFSTDMFLDQDQVVSFRAMLHLTEHHEFSTSLNMIKSPSNLLFALDEVALPNELITSIINKPDTVFLFANTSSLLLRISCMNIHEVERIFKLSDGQKLNKLIIKFGEGDDVAKFDSLGSMVKSRINELNLIYNSSDLFYLLELFHSNDEKAATWPRLTELKIECNTSFTRYPVLFELYPKLRKFELKVKGVCELFDKVFENASYLEELTLFASYGFEFTANCFYGLSNIRVLKLNCDYMKSYIESFEMISCLPNLEEQEIVKIKLLATVDTFPAELIKLKRLYLGFAYIKRIAPTMFDHLVDLEFLTISYAHRDFENDLFETGAPALRYFKCNCFNRVKFTTKNLSLIEEIALGSRFSGCRTQIHTTLGQSPMTNLKRLSLVDLSTDFSFHTVVVGKRLAIGAKLLCSQSRVEAKQIKERKTLCCRF